jgi:DNA ligase-1
MNNFNEIHDIIEDINSTNSSNEKKERLKKYSNNKDWLDILYYTYNTFIKFGVTSKAIKAHDNIPTYAQKFKVSEMFVLLDKLKDRELTGHQALDAINVFLYNTLLTDKDRDLFLKIIDNNLDLGLGIKELNKVYNKFIPTFNVQLADKYDPEKSKIDFTKEIYFSSRKLDGCRMITIINNENDIKFYSRTGHEFLTLSKLIPTMQKIAKDYKNIPVVLDGEICVIDRYGNEDFQSVMKEIRKKDYNMENPHYKVFDIIPLEDFLNMEGSTLFSERYKILKNDINEYTKEFYQFISIVEQTKVESLNHLLSMQNEAIDNGWEGLIIKKDVPYAGKRSKNLLKVKKFFDDEYTVIDITVSKKSMLNHNTGLMEERDTMGAVVIEHKGNKVQVGSGWSDEERLTYFEDKSQIVGKVITVQYFEESKNKDGSFSLRFPVKKVIHGDKRTI